MSWQFRCFLLGGLLIILASSLLILTPKASASVLSISPSSGSYAVGSTFDISIMLNTEGKSINAVKASLSFSPELLQVVSPSAGTSSVSLWASPPTYNNSTGKINLEGGYPNGTNVSSALITKITFRVKGTGNAIISYNDDSKVLLDNGKGNNDLGSTQNAVYALTLPPPEGPEIISETHPDQSRWYSENSPVLKWADPDPSLVEEYSYALSDNPTEIPDDVSDGNNTSVNYKNLSDGHHYFHIKALNEDNVWGGTTHFALNVDSNPPADFSVEIFPASSTSRRNPAIQFATTDGASGVDHYELKIIPLGNNVNLVNANNAGDQRMFIEANSPYLAQNMEQGSYDLIVRAYDASGNYKDSVERLVITNSVLQFVGDRGLVLGGQWVVSWYWLIFILVVLALILSYVVYHLREKHHILELGGRGGKIPPEIRQKMEELKELKKKYKNLAVLLAFIINFVWLTPESFAQTVSQEIEPPDITTLSKNISNDEIFYAGGKTHNPEQKITLYIKNEKTGETFNEEVPVNPKGEWFYRHDSFLTDGEYILWAQGKLGEQMSPPSPQVLMQVNKTALQFGSSRISYATLLSLLIVLLVLAVIILSFHMRRLIKKIKEKGKLFEKEIKEVEDTVHKGFMVLHRDISRELQLIDKTKKKKGLSETEKNYRQRLINDIKRIERHIEKEIIDVERLLN